MKAILIQKHGGPENLVIRDVPDPTPRPGHVTDHGLGASVFLDQDRFCWMYLGCVGGGRRREGGPSRGVDARAVDPHPHTRGTSNESDLKSRNTEAPRIS